MNLGCNSGSAEWPRARNYSLEHQNCSKGVEIEKTAKFTEMRRLVGIHAEVADRVFKSRQEERSPKRYKDRIFLVCIL